MSRDIVQLFSLKLKLQVNSLILYIVTERQFHILDLILSFVLIANHLMFKLMYLRKVLIKHLIYFLLFCHDFWTALL